jgi:hypothetical protein
LLATVSRYQPSDDRIAVFVIILLETLEIVESKFRRRFLRSGLGNSDGEAARCFEFDHEELG